MKGPLLQTGSREHHSQIWICGIQQWKHIDAVYSFDDARKRERTIWRYLCNCRWRPCSYQWLRPDSYV